VPGREDSGKRVSGGLIPVLWLCGPAGVGKTTAGWEIYSRLAQAGTEVGYVDVDQLGNFFPDPGSDPGRYRMQAENLGAVVAAFRAAGARRAIVSGVVDPAHGVYAETIPQAALTVCRLRVDADELQRRLAGREWPAELVAESLREAGAMDASDFADVCIDTSGLQVAEVARMVSEHAGRKPAVAGLSIPGRTGEPRETEAGAAGPILWLCGATGVGKSTVGYAVFVRAARAGLVGAYVDLDQIGFCSPAPPGDPSNHRVKARILAAVWQTFRAAGAQCLTMVGPAEDQAAVDLYAEALPAATIMACRLHARPDELTRRIMLRGQGSGWDQPGDPLNGQPAAHLLDVADKAAAEAGFLDRSAVGDLRIDTDGRTAQECVEALLAQSGWLARLVPDAR
jgi:adenylylsulfate kinase-like enzyme